MDKEVKLFGMPAEQGRWIFIILGMIINLCLGAVYAYSVFKKPLEELFKATATQGNMPFMVFIAVFALFMMFAGKFIDKLGPRIVMLIGGIIVGLGWMLAKFADNMTLVTLTYGLIGGAGVGLVYGGPVSVATRWFPDKKGLAVGLALAGFGGSPFITAPLANKLIASSGPLQTFFVMGLGFLIITCVLALFMSFPDPAWRPAGWTPPQAASGATAKSLTVGEMLKSPSFFGLFFCYLFGTTAGLMAIGVSATVGKEVIGLTSLALFVQIFAVFNGVGRPLFGTLADAITPKYAAVITYVIIGLASVLMLNAGQGSTVLYTIAFCGFWLTLGGWLAIAPASTASFFGMDGYAQKYGIVFLAYGLGAILGGLISGKAKDVFGSYTAAFWPTLVLAVLGIVLALALLRPPKK